MKKNILNRKFFLWLIVHLSILLLFLFRFNHRAKIETNFLSIAPKFEESADFQNSIETFFLQNSSEIKILVESEDFDKAKNSAIEIENFIKQNFKNVAVNLYSKNYDYILETIIKYKYQLISKEIRDALLNNQGDRVAEEGIANFYSPFFIPIVDNIEDDPFFVLNSKLMELLQNNNNIETRDGINFINYEEKFNILLNIDISKRFDKKINNMIFFDELTELLKKIENNKEVKIYISGVPIHAYYSQKSAQREITIISAVSLIFICLIFLFIFKSVKPYIISMISIALSSATSFFLLSILLDSIHIFTFVFGTSLIGISLDYSIHFITEWYDEKDKKEVLKKILPSMSLSFMTTISSYFALSLTSLSLLKQTALFSIFGLSSSFLTVIIIYPIIFKNDSRFLRKNILNKTKNILSAYVNFLNIKFILFLILFVILISILNIPKLKVNFSSNQLYNPPDFLARSETEVYKRLNSSLSKNIIISRGNSLTEALENEEKLENYFTNYSAISKIFYSKNRQRENIKLVENNLMPFLKKQTEYLGFDNEIYNRIKSEFESVKNETLNIENLIESMSELKKLIVKNNEKYFIISSTDETETKIIENENIKIFNINSEINEALDKTARTAIKMALIAYIIIFFFMIIFFNKKHAIALIVIQIISVLINLSVHSIFNLSVNIFSVFALILSIGISIDYCIFFSKSKAKKEVTFLSIFLSMITTALSFGTLSLSGFIPVKSFGLFLFVGILTAFLLSPVLLKIKNLNN